VRCGDRPGTGGAQPGAGRPEFEPTDAERKQVEALSGYGLPIDQIAVLVRDGIHVETLRKHFSLELVSGKSFRRPVAVKVLNRDRPDSEEFLARWDEVQQCVHDIVQTFGGSISAEHGIGQMKVAELARLHDPVALALMRSVKQALDPRGTLNPSPKPQNP
jgi:hypothetical protein